MATGFTANAISLRKFNMSNKTNLGAPCVYSQITFDLTSEIVSFLDVSSDLGNLREADRNIDTYRVVNDRLRQMIDPVSIGDALIGKTMSGDKPNNAIEACALLSGLPTSQTLNLIFMGRLKLPK